LTPRTTNHVADGSLVIERRGSVEWVTLNRPQALNALDPQMIEGLADYYRDVAEDDRVRVIVLRGAGRAFCAGLDLDAQLRGETAANARLPEIVLGMRRCPQPVIALVHGPACGGGFAMALAADVRLAGESARMNDAFVRLGVSGCELGLTYFLPRYVGLSIAAELMMTGSFIDASRAYTLGLVSTVVPDTDLEAAAGSLADEMLSLAPLALRKTKETLTRAAGIDDLATVITIETATQDECLRAGAGLEEGLRAFAEKRAPQFAPADDIATTPN
jgi:enoyl-CoA hydratase/carnithine racemase